MVETGLLNAVVTGIVTGSVIALGAIGLSLVYSIAEVPNFAHGELLMLGAYAAIFVNKPGTVPLYELFATDTQVATPVGLAVLFLLAVVGVLGIVYQLTGWDGLAGGYWNRDVPDVVGYAVHALGASVVGGLVVLTTPSVWSGLLLSMVLLGAIAPLLERHIFRKFRRKGADLATMLIVALGLSFVLRFTTQAIYGGETRTYTVPSIGEVFGQRIPLSAAQFFDFYLTGSGLVVEMINTRAVGAGENVSLFVVEYSIPALVGVVAVTAAVGYAAARWRAGTDGSTAGQTIGPKITGGLAALATVAVLAVVLPGSASVPDSSVASTRISLSLMRALTVTLALVMMGLLHVLLKETKLGIAMRASSDNLDLAKVTGINTDRVMTATWVIAGVYAAIGGVMLGVLFSQITPNVGFFLLLPMFAGVILGGIGSVYGAMVGSFVVGLSMDVGIYLLDIGTVLRVPVAFVVLFVVLLVKPEGLMGGAS
jgi:neutral amino acid transport system permease protein